MRFRVIKLVNSMIGGVLVCMLPISLSAQTLSWDTTLIEPKFQSTNGACLFGSDLIITGINNNGPPNDTNFPELIILDSLGQVKVKRPMQDTSLTFPEAVGQLIPVQGEPYIYGDASYYISKIDTSGNVLWCTRYVYPYLQDISKDFIQLRDKSVVAAGFRQFAGTGWDYFVTRIDSLGNTIWQIQYPHPGDQEATAITEMYDGSLTVGGNDGGKFRLLRIGLDGRLIQSFTRQESTGANRLFYNSMALFPDGTLITSSEGWNGTLANDHMVFVFDQNLNVIHHEIDDLFPSNFIEVNEDSSYYIFGIDQNDSSSLYMMEWPYQKTDSLLISTGSAIKFPFSFARINDQSAFIVGIQDNPAPNDNDYWYGRLDGLKKPWIPDPCQLSPPDARFSYEYNYPVLTLRDSSFSGLKYHDTVYTWQWNTSNGFSGSDDSLLVFFDTSISKTITIDLVIGNWYGCTDTVTKTLVLGATGLEVYQEFEVKVFPNPANDVLNIEYEHSRGEVFFKLYDLQGRLQIVKTLQKDKTIVSLRKLPQGLYIYEIGNTKQSQRGKIVKE